LHAYNRRLRDGIERAEHHPPPPKSGRDPGRVSAALARLRGYRIVDLDLATASSPVGRQVGDVPWPERSTLLAITRGDRAFEPCETERLERGDRLTILVPSDAADDLVDTIAADGAAATPRSGRIGE
jgi:NhaP-type Na+/H+ and K+/H+ antiporter